MGSILHACNIKPVPPTCVCPQSLNLKLGEWGLQEAITGRSKCKQCHTPITKGAARMSRGVVSAHASKVAKRTIVQPHNYHFECGVARFKDYAMRNIALVRTKRELRGWPEQWMFTCSQRVTSVLFIGIANNRPIVTLHLFESLLHRILWRSHWGTCRCKTQSPPPLRQRSTSSGHTFLVDQRRNAGVLIATCQ
jgi:hypothetical protein